MKQIRLLALDPSITRTGWCVLDGPPPVHLEAAEFGSFASDNVLAFAQQLNVLMIQHRPQFVVYEQSLPFIALYGKKGLLPEYEGSRLVTPNATQLMLPKLEGAIVGVATASGLDGQAIQSVAPRTWRAAVLGDGNMKKAQAKGQAQLYVSRLGLHAKNHDAAEAICLGMYGASSQSFRWHVMGMAKDVEPT